MVHACGLMCLIARWPAKMERNNEVMSAPNLSGQINLDGDMIIHIFQEREAWRVRAPDIRVIGEFTNTDGPHADDYFFVFITPDQWFEASFYAEGRDALFAELGSRFGHMLQPGLCYSTSLASRVLYPPRLEGHPLFDVIPAKRASTLFGRLWQRVFPRVDLHFTGEVKKEVES